MPAWSVDGMDVEAVEDAARRAAPTIRAAAGRCFLELRTYRFRAHSMYDPDLYRAKEEIARWRERDPIDAARRRACAAEGLATTTTSRRSRPTSPPRSTTPSPSPRPARSSRSRTSPGSCYSRGDGMST